MTRVFARVAGGLAAAVLMVGAVPAIAANKDTPAAALRDCGAGNDPLRGHYSVKVLQTALRDLQTNSLQYTTCADALENAINAQFAARKHKPTGGTRKPPSTGPAVPPPATKASPPPTKRLIERLNAEGGRPFMLPTGQTLTPGAVTSGSASFLSGLPTPLVIVLAVLLAAVLAVAGRTLNRIVRTRRSH